MRKLNFGCGNDLKDGWDNADIQNEAPMSFDFNRFPYPIKDNTYDYILVKQVLEHLKEPNKVLDELWRISKHNAIIKSIVSDCSNRGGYGSFEHKHYFSEIAFKEYCEEWRKIRKVNKFEIIKLELLPTEIGCFFPKFIRNKLCLFIGGLIGNIDCEMRVIKDGKVVENNSDVYKHIELKNLWLWSDFSLAERLIFFIPYLVLWQILFFIHYWKGHINLIIYKETEK